MEHKRLNTESQVMPQSPIQNEYFTNSLKSQAKRFSSLVLSNSINSIDDKKIYFKIFLLTLEKPVQERTEAEVQAIAKILKEETLFPQFKNNITILRLLAKQIKIRHLQPNQFLFTCNTKDQNMYKVLKGEVTIKKIRDGTSIVKSKGELLQTFEEFKLIKDTEVQSKEQTFVITLNYHQYQQALKLQKQNKTIMQMLTKTSIFSKFKRKELLYLIQNSQEVSLVCKEVLFNEGDASNGFFYFLVEGELAVYKISNVHRKQVVCYVTEGSLIGEQSLFDEDRPRIYTVSTQSSHAKILQISCSKLQQTIKHFELNVEQILTKKYQDFLMLRDKHYLSQLQENSEIKQTFQPPKTFTKMSPIKQQQMSNLLKDVENFTLKLNNKQKIIEKRYQNGKQYSKLISVERPLFGRQDVQSLKHLAKRYGLNEVKPKENCKLPHL